MRQGNCLKLFLRIKLTFSDAPEAISRINGGKIYAGNLRLVKQNIWKYACPMVRLTAKRNDKGRVHNRGSMRKLVIHNPYLYTQGYKEISPVLHARTKDISVRTPVIHSILGCGLQTTKTLFCLCLSNRKTKIRS